MRGFHFKLVIIMVTYAEKMERVRKILDGRQFYDIIEREVKSQSGHVHVGREYVGEKAIIILISKDA